MARFHVQGRRGLAHVVLRGFTAVDGGSSARWVRHGHGGAIASREACVMDPQEQGGSGDEAVQLVGCEHQQAEHQVAHHLGVPAHAHSAAAKVSAWCAR